MTWEPWTRRTYPNGTSCWFTACQLAGFSVVVQRHDDGRFEVWIAGSSSRRELLTPEAAHRTARQMAVRRARVRLEEAQRDRLLAVSLPALPPLDEGAPDGGT
jgi:hypothetical protein